MSKICCVFITALFFQEACSSLIILGRDPDLDNTGTGQVITDPDPTGQVISYPDPDPDR